MDRFPQAADVDFHSPLDLSKAAAAVLDDEGRVSGWGAAAQRLLGHSPDDVGRLRATVRWRCWTSTRPSCSPGWTTWSRRTRSPARTTNRATGPSG